MHKERKLRWFSFVRKTAGLHDHQKPHTLQSLAQHVDHHRDFHGPENNRLLELIHITFGEQEPGKY